MTAIQQRDADVTLAELFDADLLRHCLDERLVVARKHPSAPLTILNYTERCQYERGLWNPVTLACRGLIHDEEGRIVARPFRKFFNYGQQDGGEFDSTARVIVTDKLDGSLGILYPTGDGHAIATRGAFLSEQAIHASALWQFRYEQHVTVPRGWTFLFEIVYPTNRIVLDYGQRDELVLLGAVDIATGRSVRPEAAAHMLGWTHACADTFDCRSLADALAIPPRANAEGLVVHFIDTDERLKIKQEDYVALHKIVTGLNERTVWECLCEGKPLSELLGALPDEFHGWVSEVAARLTATVESNAAEVERAYSIILGTLPAEPTRKDFALQAKDHALRGQLFNRHDGKDYRASLWQMAKPEPRIGPRAVNEEAA
jgi:RNA ligase